MTTTTAEFPPQTPEILTRSDGASIAYHRVTCQNDKNAKPTVIFLHGLLSDMDGGKSLELEEYAQENDFNFVRFDMFGHGKSSGDFTDGSIGRWCDDTIAVINELTEGPIILVGSSMGGWVMLRVAMQFQAQGDTRIRGLIGIAPAPDFTEEFMWKGMSGIQQQELMAGKIVTLYPDPDNTDWGYPISKILIEDGRKNLLYTQPIAYDGPVRILQGMEDDAVNWQTALRITEGLTSQDVTIDFVKDGDHRLSRPQDLARLTRTVDELMRDIMMPWPVEE